jgi:hypothetical protein
MGAKTKSQRPKTIAKIAEGHVIIYHKRFAISFICVDKISLSGDAFWDDSM